MKQPRVFTLGINTLLMAWVALGTVGTYGQTRSELAEDLAENWYRTEVLIFVRESAESRQAEQWDPLPDLQYPEQHRYLIDPGLADRRLEESLAFASAIDARGIQSLTLPSPVTELLDYDRPDALTVPPDPQPGALSDTPGTAAVLESDGSLDADTEQSVDVATEPDLTSPILSLPYELLSDENLEFQREANSLRRQGHSVVFHSSWWATLDDAASTPALIIDRSGDMDSQAWPALQGSLQVYRSRYLHIVLDLWLNTLGENLPEGWQIDAPALPRTSLKATTLDAQDINPWAPAEMSEAPEQYSEQSNSPAGSWDNDASPDYVANRNADRAADYGSIADSGAGSGAEPRSTPGSNFGQSDGGNARGSEHAKAEEPTLRGPQYPWRHAIMHKQTRRMRSNEIHYLDHPVIGVIVKVTPMSEEALPLFPPARRAFRERHGLAVEVVPMGSGGDEP